MVHPGFRFYPTEEELVCFYLSNKLEHKRLDISRVIPLLDIYKFEPCQLPKHCGELCRGDKEQWFFFVPRHEKEGRGGRPSRTTTFGYWKATGSPSYVYSSDSKVLGVKKSMVFYKGKAGSGRKTKWKMNEYTAIKQDLPTSIPKLRNELSLCRVYVVSGSFRAFDRRPIAKIETSSGPDQIPKITEEIIDDVSNDHDENGVKSMEKISCSGESSFSGGEILHKEGFDWEMIHSLENLLELECEYIN